jgi:hypothetical protein
MRVLRLLRDGGAILFSLIILAHWAAFFLWFLPLVAILLYLFIGRPHWSPQWSMLSLAAAATFCGIWSLLLISLAPILPPFIQEFLVLHIDSFVQPTMKGRYGIGGLSGGEFLGYIALISVGGLLMLLLGIAMVGIARTSLSRPQRVWMFRIVAPCIVGLTTWVVYVFASDYWVLFAFCGYFAALACAFAGVDPHEMFNEPEE